MPAPGVPNNPNGYNAFGGPMEREEPYGAIKKLQNLAALAPTAQPTAVNAPRRSQRHASGQDKPGRGSRTPASAPSAPPGEPTVPYEAILGGFWNELAAEPGASPLVQEIAGGLSGR